MKAGSILAAVLLAAAALSLEPVQAGAHVECGRAAWYRHTSRTANGERGNPGGYTAAHKTLPFGTMVMVENLNNGRIVQVRINDRGPYTRGRVIDLTKAAASALGFIRSGTAKVKVSTPPPDPRQFRPILRKMVQIPTPGFTAPPRSCS